MRTPVANRTHSLRRCWIVLAAGLTGAQPKSGATEKTSLTLRAIDSSSTASWEPLPDLILLGSRSLEGLNLRIDPVANASTFLRPVEGAETTHLVLVKNWLDELRTRGRVRRP